MKPTCPKCNGVGRVEFQDRAHGIGPSPLHTIPCPRCAGDDEGDE